MTNENGTPTFTTTEGDTMHESTMPTANVNCASCGKYTGLDTHCCGDCAVDYNTRDRAAGLRRLNGRRKANGLPPIDHDRNVVR